MGLTVNENFQYEVSNRSMLIAQLKELQRSTNFALRAVDGNFVEKPTSLTGTPDIKPASETRHRRQHKVIRRRRKMVYSQADQLLSEKTYWQLEKRSLTKFHSNSLMYEYSIIK